MAKPKFDVVIEAVRYKADGEVDWVRAYERRGPTFSDLVLIGRAAVIERLKAGQRFVVGRRVSQMASTFEVSGTLRLVRNNGSEVLVTNDNPADRDKLDGVPVL